MSFPLQFAWQCSSYRRLSMLSHLESALSCIEALGPIYDSLFIHKEDEPQARMLVHLQHVAMCTAPLTTTTQLQGQSISFL
jgi:hypothetical protein